METNLHSMKPEMDGKLNKNPKRLNLFTNSENWFEILVNYKLKCADKLLQYCCSMILIGWWTFDDNLQLFSGKHKLTN